MEAGYLELRLGLPREWPTYSSHHLLLSRVRLSRELGFQPGPLVWKYRQHSQCLTAAHGPAHDRDALSSCALVRWRRGFYFQCLHKEPLQKIACGIVRWAWLVSQNGGTTWRVASSRPRAASSTTQRRNTQSCVV